MTCVLYCGDKTSRIEIYLQQTFSAIIKNKYFDKFVQFNCLLKIVLPRGHNYFKQLFLST